MNPRGGQAEEEARGGPSTAEEEDEEDDDDDEDGMDGPQAGRGGRRAKRRLGEDRRFGE